MKLLNSPLSAVTELFKRLD